MKKNRPKSCGTSRFSLKAFVSVAALLLVSATAAFAQKTVDVTGKVIDSEGQPVIGAREKCFSDTILTLRIYIPGS